MYLLFLFVKFINQIQDIPVIITEKVVPYKRVCITMVGLYNYVIILFIYTV